MIKDVVIDIKGVQGIDDQTDTIEFSTDGRYGIKDGEYYLSYNEGELLEGIDEVKTRIYIKNQNSVILQREGGINSRMNIEKGVRNSCFYSTPIGDIAIGVFGQVIDFQLNESGGNIELQYTIDSNLQTISKNKVNISIREVK